MISSITEFRGQEAARKMLGNAMSRGVLQGTLLFAGTRGLGKTTLARCVGLALNCEAPDADEPLSFCGSCYSCNSILAREQPEFVEIRPIGQDIRVEQFEGSKSRSKKDDQEGRREHSVFHTALMKPAYLKWRVFLIDGAHYLNRSTGNQLLKLLEEAPARTIFILVSDKPGMMLPTILSRSRQFNLTAIPGTELAEYLLNDCPDVSTALAEEVAGMAAGRYVDAVALAASDHWRESVKAMSAAICSARGIDETGEELARHELELLLKTEFQAEADKLDELAAGLTAARRNELGRQSIASAYCRAAWWALQVNGLPPGILRDLTVLKARIEQNVDPGLATAAFAEARKHDR